MRIPFDLTVALSGVPVVTRNGYPATVRRRNLGDLPHVDSAYTVVSVIKDYGQHTHGESGHYWLSQQEHPLDLFLVASEKPHVLTQLAELEAFVKQALVQDPRLEEALRQRDAAEKAVEKFRRENDRLRAQLATIKAAFNQ